MMPITEGGFEVILNKRTVMMCIAWFTFIGSLGGSLGYVFAKWREVDEWVRWVNSYVGTPAKDDPPGAVEALTDRIREIEKVMSDQSRASQTHCLLGNINRQWCIDQGLKVPPLPLEPPPSSGDGG